MSSQQASVQTIAPNVELHTIDEVIKQFEGLTPQLSSSPYSSGVIVAKDGRVFVRTMIAAPGKNRHNWALNAGLIPKNIATIKGTPLTFAMQKAQVAGETLTDFPHPAVDNAPWFYNQDFQRAYTIGHYVDYEKKPDSYGVWHGIAEVTHDKAKEYFVDLAKTKELNIFPLYVSPQVLHEDSENPLDLHNWWFQHVTITGEPAYSKELAKITESCSGDEHTCVNKLSRAYAGSAVKQQIVDASECPVCVKEALSNIICNQTVRNNDSSLITKSASLEQSMTDNNSTSGQSTANADVATTGAGASGAGSNSQGNPPSNTPLGNVSVEQTPTTKTYSPTQIHTDADNRQNSGILDAQNIPEQLNKIVQEQIAKSMAPLLEKLNLKDTNVKPESKKTETITEAKVEAETKAAEAKKALGEEQLTEREKALIERVNAVEKNNAKLLEGDKRRKVEMTLLSFKDGQQFLDDKGKFLEDRFQKQVEYWMGKGLEPEQIETELQTMLDMVGPIAKASSGAGAGGCSCGKNHSDSGQPTGETPTADASRAYAGEKIYGVPDVETSNRMSDNDIKMQNASMNQIVSPDDLYFLKLEKRVVLRTNVLGDAY